MKIKQLISQWNSLPKVEEDGDEYCLKISKANTASIEAIKELYPGLSSQMIISQLLSMALAAYEEALPYVPGDKIVAEDEMGDPIFEDIGLTPKYQELVKKHAQLINQ